MVTWTRTKTIEIKERQTSVETIAPTLYNKRRIPNDWNEKTYVQLPLWKNKLSRATVYFFSRGARDRGLEVRNVPKTLALTVVPRNGNNGCRGGNIGRCWGRGRATSTPRVNTNAHVTAATTVEKYATLEFQEIQNERHASQPNDSTDFRFNFTLTMKSKGMSVECSSSEGCVLDFEWDRVIACARRVLQHRTFEKSRLT